MLGWDVADLMEDLTPPNSRSQESSAAPYQSPDLGALFDSVAWSDQVLVSANDLLALISLDRESLKPRGYIPFETPRVSGKPARLFLPAFVVAIEDVAFLSFVADDRAGLMRLELTTGAVTYRVYGEAGALPQLCVADARVYFVDRTTLLEIDPNDLRVIRKVGFPGPVGALACSKKDIAVGEQSKPELHWINRLTMQAVRAAKWEGRSAISGLFADDGRIVVADEDAGLVAWCDRLDVVCKATRTQPRPVELTIIDERLGVIVRGSYSLGKNDDALEFYDSETRNLLGRRALPREARGASLV